MWILITGIALLMLHNNVVIKMLLCCNNLQIIIKSISTKTLIIEAVNGIFSDNIIINGSNNKLQRIY